jgi:hypothetical protein
MALMDVKQNINSVELLYFDDCPSWRVALKNIKEALSQLKIPVNVSLIHIDTHVDAQKHAFPGSPTIRVNKKDIFPVNHTNYALGCRMYQTKEGFKGFPTVEMIVRNTRDFLKKRN